MNTFQRLESVGLFSPRNVNHHNKKPIYEIHEDRSTLIGWMDCFQANAYADQVRASRTEDAA